MLRTIAAFDRIGEENAFAVLARATALAAQGRDIVNLGIGQPDFSTPPHIVEAAVKALRDGHHGYTPATGILPLREAVAADLFKRYGMTVSPDSVLIVPGGKVTMFMAILMFGEPGADILYPDPGFPIYRSMIEFTGANPVIPLLTYKNLSILGSGNITLPVGLTLNGNGSGDLVIGGTTQVGLTTGLTAGSLDVTDNAQLTLGGQTVTISSAASTKHATT